MSTDSDDSMSEIGKTDNEIEAIIAARLRLEPQLFTQNIQAAWTIIRRVDGHNGYIKSMFMDELLLIVNARERVGFSNRFEALAHLFFTNPVTGTPNAPRFISIAAFNLLKKLDTLGQAEDILARNPNLEALK